MTAELEDLKERLERLESHFDTAEYRMDMLEATVEIRFAGGRPWADAQPDKTSPTDSAGQTEHSEQEPSSGRLDSMVRSSLLHHASHNRDLRTALRYLEILIKRKSS